MARGSGQQPRAPFAGGNADFLKRTRKTTHQHVPHTSDKDSTTEAASIPCAQETKQKIISVASSKLERYRKLASAERLDTFCQMSSPRSSASTAVPGVHADAAIDALFKPMPTIHARFPGMTGCLLQEAVWKCYVVALC